MSSVHRTPLTGGYGYLSRLFRLELNWTGEGASDAPRTLVAKLPFQARLDAMTPDAVRMFRREAMFHRVVAANAPLRTAKAWVTEFDEDSGAASMVFEDLGWMDSFGDDDTVSVERVENALVQLAALHARYWESDELETTDWLAHPAESGVDQVSTERFAALWPRLVASSAYELSPTQHRLGELLSTKLDGVYEALHAGPKSMIHADLHQENLFFDGNEATFIDWALAERANPAKDIAKLTASCLEPGTVGREQPGLIRTYWKTLASHGALPSPPTARLPDAAQRERGHSGISIEDLEHHVHLATCHYLAMMSFLSDRDFNGLASSMDTRTDFTTSHVITACDREEIVAVVEAL